MVEISGGQVARGAVSVNQCVEIQNVIAGDLSAKVDIKRSRRESKQGTNSAVFSFDNIVCNIKPADLQLAILVYHQNISKLKFDLGKGS